MHLVFVAHATHTELYVDGRLQGTIQIPVNLPRKSTGTDGDQLHGSIDEVQLFDRALAADEIENLFQNVSPTP